MDNAEIKAQGIILQAEKDAEFIVTEVLKDAEAIKTEIISSAELTKKRILDDAQNKVLSMYGEIGSYSLTQNADFARKIQRDLQNASNEIISLADGIKYSYFRQTALELIALYNIIHTAYTYHAEKARALNISDYTNCVDTVNGFIERIAETLSCNGVTPFCSKKGQAFDGLIHENANPKAQFDPKTASVKKSIRLGFADGGGIIQKELIEI